MQSCTDKLTVWKPRHLTFFSPSSILCFLLHPPTPVNESERVKIKALPLSTVFILCMSVMHVYHRYTIYLSLLMHILSSLVFVWTVHLHFFVSITSFCISHLLQYLSFVWVVNYAFRSAKVQDKIFLSALKVLLHCILFTLYFLRTKWSLA